MLLIGAVVPCDSWWPKTAKPDRHETSAHSKCCENLPASVQEALVAKLQGECRQSLRVQDTQRMHCEVLGRARAPRSGPPSLLFTSTRLELAGWCSAPEVIGRVPEIRKVTHAQCLPRSPGHDL
jgi:hypothetical protein